MPYFFDPETRTPKELVPGVVVRTFWGEQMLASLVDLAAGAIVPATATRTNNSACCSAGDCASPSRARRSS